MHSGSRWILFASSALALLAYAAAGPVARYRAECAGSPNAPAPARVALDPEARSEVRGMTISCQTYGPEWGSDGFGVEVERLSELGVNWVAIHPYAGIRADGSLHYRPFTSDDAPKFFTRPIREAHARGAKILIKPHIAYWGSPFSWRGEIDFEGEDLTRFFEQYAVWIRLLAEATRDADAFCVGTELDKLIGHDERWRGIVRDVRAVTDAPLTYAANWTDYARVPFWDALDVIGIQAYFPLSEAQAPTAQELDRGWSRVLSDLRRYSAKHGRRVCFTELGYDASLETAREPWNPARPAPEARPRAEALQALALERALVALERERDWLVGAFLWKWFVGPSRSNFRKDTPHMREVMEACWADAD